MFILAFFIVILLLIVISFTFTWSVYHWSISKIKHNRKWCQILSYWLVFIILPTCYVVVHLCFLNIGNTYLSEISNVYTVFFAGCFSISWYRINKNLEISDYNLYDTVVFPIFSDISCAAKMIQIVKSEINHNK